MPHRPASDALSHITVLDLTRARAGPTAVRQLADWGADVIKIEPPESVVPEGSLGPSRHSSDFQNLQRNKRSMTLNLKEAEGRALFLRLAEKADVVVENFRPDVKDRLGISYETLKAINKSIILASISGFGQSGPYAKRPGFDQIAQGMGGLMSITGEPGRGPMRVGIPIADLCSGLFCALGILTAIIERQKSGEGQWLHTSLLQAQIFMLDFQASRWLMAGEVAPQAGNNHPTSVPTGLVRTKDGAMNIAAAGNVIWERFTKAIGRPEWTNHPDFKDMASRYKNRERLMALIEEVTCERTSQEWVELLSVASVPCGPVYDIEQVFADPQVRSLGIDRPVNTTAFGETKCVGQPVALTRTPATIAARTPERGEHTDEILGDIGLSKDEIYALRERAII